MKAYVLNGINDLQYLEIPQPELQPGWCLVQVKAAGICSSDIPRIFTKGTYHFPTICGHEFSGIVTKVADEENGKWVGKHVGVFPLIPCKACPQCAEGKYELCQNYDYIGSRRDGAFAEFVAVPVWNLIPVAENVPFRASAMLEPISVALHAVKRANIQKGDAVGVIGTGMIGFVAAQWAKTFGAAQVDIIGRSEGKRALAENVPGIGYKLEADLSPESYDVVIEAVGTEDAINRSLTVTKAGGTLVLMGNPAGDIQLEQNTYWRILRKQLTVTGTWNSSYESGAICDWSEAAEALATGALQVLPLISHCFSQDALPEGLDLMKNHTKAYCKVMTLWNEDKTK